jgi:hypothetical protein
VVANHPQSYGIDPLAPLRYQVARCCEIVIGPNPNNPESLSQESGPEVTVQAARPKADADNVFHGWGSHVEKMDWSRYMLRGENTIDHNQPSSRQLHYLWGVTGSG